MMGRGGDGACPVHEHHLCHQGPLNHLMTTACLFAATARIRITVTHIMAWPHCRPGDEEAPSSSKLAFDQSDQATSVGSKSAMTDPKAAVDLQASNIQGSQDTVGQKTMLDHLGCCNLG